MRRLSLSLLLLALAACSTDPRTEVIVVVDSDLMVPGELDQLTIDVTSPDGETQSSNAALGDGDDHQHCHSQKHGPGKTP